MKSCEVYFCIEDFIWTHHNYFYTLIEFYLEHECHTWNKFLDEYEQVLLEHSANFTYVFTSIKIYFYCLVWIFKCFYDYFFIDVKLLWMPTHHIKIVSIRR